MLTVMFYLAIWLFFLFFLGSGLCSLFLSRRGNVNVWAQPLSLSIALSMGLCAVSMASLWSFGSIGLRWFVLIVVFFLVASVVGFVKSGLFSFHHTKVNFSRFSSLTGVFALVFVLAKPYLDSLLGSRITGGFGPDLTQNLMAIDVAKTYDGTWHDLKTTFLMGQPSLYSSYERLFEISSMQQQAFLDYLLFGTRWGYTIPLSQITEQVDQFYPHIQTFSFVSGFLLSSIIFNAYLLAIGFSYKKSFTCTVLFLSNSSLLIQFFNGGLAQIWALPGLVGVLCYCHYRLFVSLDNNNLEKSIRLLFLSSTVTLVATYVDGLVGIGLVLLPSLLVCSLNSAIRARIKSSLKNDATLYLATLFLSSPIIFPLLETVKLRSELASWTGINYPNWMTPLEFFGLSNEWIWGRNRESLIIQFVIIVIIISLGLYSLKNRKRWIDITSISIMFMLLGTAYLVGLVVSSQGSQSNYTFVKISGYIYPLIILLLAAAIDSSKASKTKRFFDLSLTFIAIISLMSGIFTSNTISQRSSYSLASNQLAIRQDSNAQSELEEFNYMTTYTPHSNLLGIYGDVHWISRPPNSLKLGDRTSRELRVICLTVDNACRPNGIEVVPSSLNKYGYRVFKVSNDSSLFQKLSPEDRYAFNFQQVGQAPFAIPPEFIGTFRFR